MNLWIAKGWCWILRQEPGCQQYTSCSGAAANQHLLLNIQQNQVVLCVYIKFFDCCIFILGICS